MAVPVSGVRVGKTKRILWLIDSMTTGGAERLVPVFARAYDRSRFELDVACLKEIEGNPIARELDFVGVPLTTMHAKNLRDLFAFFRLVRFIRKNKFDLIHTHLTYSDIWGRIAGSILRIPVVSTVHVRYYNAQNVSALRARHIESLAGWCRKMLGGPVITVSEALRQHFIRQNYSPDRLATIRNGVVVQESRQVDRGRIRTELGIPESSSVVISVSTLRDGKGHHLLLNAAGHVLKTRSDTYLVVVGGGYLENELRNRVANNGLHDRVVFTGLRHDVADLMAAADLFVLPSIDDSLPTVFLEAMSEGLPTIGLDSGGVPEMIENGVTGIVVSEHDDRALARAIAYLIENRTKAREMGIEGRRRIESEFNSRLWAQRIGELYDQVLSKQ